MGLESDTRDWPPSPSPSPPSSPRSNKHTQRLPSTTDATSSIIARPVYYPQNTGTSNIRSLSLPTTAPPPSRCPPTLPWDINVSSWTSRAANVCSPTALSPHGLQAFKHKSALPPDAASELESAAAATSASIARDQLSTSLCMRRCTIHR
ncbi:hypothetical protein K466DRAFT_668089, partial [Polyporus arcularius HHB13444]